MLICGEAPLGLPPPRPPGFGGLPAPVTHPLAQLGGWAMGWVRRAGGPLTPGGLGAGAPQGTSPHIDLTHPLLSPTRDW